MRLYFKDSNNELRVIEGDFPYGINEQSRLCSMINSQTDIKCKLPIFESVQSERTLEDMLNEAEAEIY